MIEELQARYVHTEENGVREYSRLSRIDGENGVAPTHILPHPSHRRLAPLR